MSYGPYGSPQPSYATPAYTGDPTAVLGRRYLAYIIDSLVTGVVVVIMFFGATKSISTGGDPSYCSNYRIDNPNHICFQLGTDNARVAEGSALVPIYGAGFVIWLLETLLEGVLGGTVGKLAVGLRVVKHDGSVCGIGRAIGRRLLLVIDGACCALPGIISSSTSKGHKRIGDMAAGTLVVSASQVGKPLNVPGVTTPVYGGYPSGYSQPSPYAGGVGGPYPPAGGYGGVGGPYPSATPPAATPPASSSGGEYQADAPTWDSARNTYIQYDTARAAWLEYDQATREWKPISQ